MPKKISDEDSKLFRSLMRDVIPLESDKVHHSPLQTSNQNKKFISSKSTKERLFLSDHISHPVSADKYLSFTTSGIQPRYFRRLKNAQLPIEATLDLHGLTTDEARDAFQKFMQNCKNQGLRVILIVHGKGHRSQAQHPRLKNLINSWLHQLPYILAFCSAQPKHGGTGAVYVLLKK